MTLIPNNPHRVVWTTVPTATATVFANKLPAPLAAYAAADVKAACSSFIKAPIPNPWTSTVETNTRTATLTAYDSTITSTVTSSSTAILVTAVSTETFTFRTIVPAEVVWITSSRTTSVTTAIASTLQLTRKVRQTSYSTVRVPTLRAVRTVTSTTSGTATMTYPLICETLRASSSLLVVGGGRVLSTEKSADSRAACCALCEETTGCVHYQFYAAGQCFVGTVTEGNGKLNPKSAQCPLGQLEGRFVGGTSGVYGVGSCWNGQD